MTKRESHFGFVRLHKVWVKSICSLLLVLFIFPQFVNAKPFVFEKSTTNLFEANNKLFSFYYSVLFSKDFSKRQIPMESNSGSNENPLSDENEPIDDDEFEKFLEAHHTSFNFLLFEQLNQLLARGVIQSESPQSIPLFVLHHSWKIFIL